MEGPRLKFIYLTDYYTIQRLLQHSVQLSPSTGSVFIMVHARSFVNIKSIFYPESFTRSSEKTTKIFQNDH
jgi:hypothetical protein